MKMKRFFLMIVALLVFFVTARIPAVSGVEDENEFLSIKKGIPVESNELRIELIKKEIKDMGTYSAPRILYSLQLMIVNLTEEAITVEVRMGVKHALKEYSRDIRKIELNLNAENSIIIKREGKLHSLPGYEQENEGWALYSFNIKGEEEVIKLKVKVP